MSFAPRQEPEQVPGLLLAATGLTIVLATVVGVLVAWRIERVATKHVEEYSNTPEPPPLGAIDRTLLESRSAPPALAARDAQRAELGRWGWADRDAGVARVPIDRAIDLWIAAQATSDGGP
jgi:hypothetical protein